MSGGNSDTATRGAFRDDFEALRRELGKVVVGQRDVVDGMLTATICGGHLLIEGVPGVGKTVLVETLADVTRATFQRIQFTTDLMPADLIGTYVVMESAQGRRTFEFHKGPLFSHVVLADHINRGTPKAQAALLEAMEGQSVSVSNETFELPQPFVVVATQNPLEMEGTYPLPEPQLDRFFMKVIAKPPTEAEMEAILERTTEGESPVVAEVVDDQRLLEMREVARAMPIAAELRKAVVRLVAATHPDHARTTDAVRQFVRYGASPRAAQTIVLAAKVHALAEGRDQVSSQDVLSVVLPALRHRLILNFRGQTEGVSTDELIEELVQELFGGKAAS